MGTRSMIQRMRGTAKEGTLPTRVEGTSSEDLVKATGNSWVSEGKSLYL